MMKLRKLLTTLLTAIGIASAGNASAIIVGGIDFGALGTTSHLETTTVAETVVLNVGDNLMGYGVINVVNGDASYCAVDANCRLFFTFTGYNVISFASDHVEFNLGTINIYYDPGTGGANTGFSRNLLDFSSVANMAYISALTEWVQLAGHDNSGVPGGCDVAGATLCADGTLTGSSLSFTGQGLLDVVLGAFGIPAVQAYWDNNNINDFLGGFADIALGTEGNTLVHNPNDTCSDPPQAGEFCIQGTASIRGTIAAVPEPGTLLLLGVGLAGLGLGGLRRKNLAV